MAMLTHQGSHQPPCHSALGTATYWMVSCTAVRGMEEYDVTSLQKLIHAATDGGLQALYGEFPIHEVSNLAHE